MENNNYILSKNAIGIILIWMGPPLFYFIRSEFHLGGGTITSGVFYLLSLLLLTNQTKTQIGYKPNLKLLIFGGTFYIFALLYFVLFNSNTSNRLTESFNIVTTITFFILLLKIDNKVQKQLPFWIVIITLILNVALIYSVISNPNYVLGQRATVQFGEGDFTGNPGMYARNGLFGLIISILFLHKREHGLFKQNTTLGIFTSSINIILSIITIIITQTRMILLSLIIITFFYLLFIRNKQKSNTPNNTKRKYNYSLISLMLLIIMYINNRYNLSFILINYFNNYWNMFQRALNTGITLGNTNKTEIDDSAMGRVRSINEFKDIFNFEKFNLLFGKGYGFRYLDIPILEILINFGIFGLILFGMFIFSTFVSSIGSMKSNTVFQNFLGLTFMQVFIGLFTAGRPMDLAFCIIYFVYIRFLSVKVEN